LHLGHTRFNTPNEYLTTVCLVLPESLPLVSSTSGYRRNNSPGSPLSLRVLSSPSAPLCLIDRQPPLHLHLITSPSHFPAPASLGSVSQPRFPPTPQDSLNPRPPSALSRPSAAVVRCRSFSLGCSPSTSQQQRNGDERPPWARHAHQHQSSFREEQYEEV